MITAFQSNAFQKSPKAFQIASAVVIVDTHDDAAKRDEAFRKRNEALKSMVIHAFEAEFPLPIFDQVKKIAETKDAPIPEAKIARLAILYEEYIAELQEQEEEEILMVLH